MQGARGTLNEGDDLAGLPSPWTLLVTSPAALRMT